MNQGQKKFHDFYSSMVKEENVESAELLLTECFEKQDAGTFDQNYLRSIKDKMFEMIKPECTEQLKNAMQHLSSNS